MNSISSLSLKVIQKPDSMSNDNEIQVIATNINDIKDLDSTKSIKYDLHPYWLRERCTSPLTVQVSTKQPLHEYYTLPENLKIVEAYLKLETVTTGCKKLIKPSPSVESHLSKMSQNSSEDNHSLSEECSTTDDDENHLSDEYSSNNIIGKAAVDNFKFNQDSEIVNNLNDNINSDRILHITFSDGLKSRFNEKDLLLEIQDFQNASVQYRSIDFPVPIIYNGSKVNADLNDGTSKSLCQTKEPLYMDFHTLFPDYKEIVTNSSSDNVNDSEDSDTKSIMHQLSHPPSTITLIKHLIQYGHVIITNTPTYSGAVTHLGGALTQFNQVRPTNWGSYFNVQSKADKGRNDIAYTCLPLPPHVDNPYRDPAPCFQLLHTLANDCNGGYSFAIDGFAIAEEIRREYPEYFRVLSTVGLRWENDGGSGDSGMSCIAPMIQLEQVQSNTNDLNSISYAPIKQIRYSGKSGGYAPIMSSYEESSLFFKARNYFSKLLNETERQVHFRLNKGDVWLFNNLRLLHGRTGFEVDGARHLQGCYIDIDGLQYAYHKAQNKVNNLGKEEEEKEMK